ncbi:MAG: alkaline phosphatase family protein [Paenibacillaceae bacterium]|nr:alkaline phosphatase family protein [Paenibacillaceae bacterium]
MTNTLVGNKESRVLLISIDGMAHYYLNDPHVRMPHLRKLMRQGVTADKMESVFPTATWAIHTSLVTGAYPRKTGVLGNWVVDRHTGQVGEHFGDRMWGKEESVNCETLYDAAKRSGWTTASICWPVTRGAAAIDSNIPEFYEQELFDAYCTPGLMEELREAGFPVECYGKWSTDHARGPMQDWLTAEIANYLIRTKSPRLLMMHFLLPDSLQHDYGTRSKEVYWSLEHTDERIGEVIAELERQQLLDSTTIFVVSDHGFVDTIRSFYPNVLFRQRGWLDPDRPDENRVMSVSNGGSGYVYVMEDDPERNERLREEARAALAGAGVVHKIFEPGEFPSIGLPARGELERFRPDFAFVVEPDCFVHFEANGEHVVEQRAKFYGMHGYLPTLDEMKAIFVASGPAVRSGLTIPEMRIVDVAPTIARLIGVELPAADGRALDAIWK